MGEGVVFFSLCQVRYRAGRVSSWDELTNTPSKVILVCIQTSLQERASTLAGPGCSEALESGQPPRR